MLTVRALYVHPIKSARAVAVDSAEVGDRGLVNDRRFMVVDGSGRFLSQRSHPRMTLIEPALDGERMRLRAPGLPELDLPRAPSDGEPLRVTVFEHAVDAITVAVEADAWLTRFLGSPCRLVYMPDASVRPIVDDGVDAATTRVSFADAYPFLLASRASIEEVAHGSALPPDELTLRLRPNIVVDGCGPFAEDDWTSVTLGAVRFAVIRECARCALPNVNPATAQVGKEPLAALSRTRRREGKVRFGGCLIQEGRGRITVGDAVVPVERVAPL